MLISGTKGGLCVHVSVSFTHGLIDSTFHCISHARYPVTVLHSLCRLSHSPIRICTKRCGFVTMLNLHERRFMCLGVKLSARAGWCTVIGNGGRSSQMSSDISLLISTSFCVAGLHIVSEFLAHYIPSFIACVSQCLWLRR